MNLYEIDAKLNELLENGFNEECIDQETGEFLEDKAKDLLEQYQADRNVKIENIALLIKNLNAEADAIKAEEMALGARRKAKENKAKYLKEYLSNDLIRANESKFESARVALTFRKSTSVLIGEDLPKEYITEETVYKVDKTFIKKQLQNGEKIPGARLEIKQNLQIK